MFEHWPTPLFAMRRTFRQYFNLSKVVDLDNDKMAETDKFISQAEAARLRGVSKQAIANLIKRGRLSTIEVAGRSLVLKNEVTSFVAKPRTGRPRRKQPTKKSAPKKTISTS